VPCKKLVCVIRGESGQFRAAHVSEILELRVVSGVQHMSACNIRGERGQWHARN